MPGNKTLDCLVAGDANVDLLLDGVIQLEPGREKLARSMDLVLGGSSAITAHNLAGLGTRVGFAGIIGDDLFGQFVARKLGNAGVDLGTLKVIRKEKTGITVWLSSKGRRAAVTCGGTSARVNASSISSALHVSRHLHVGAYFLLKGLHRGAPALFRKARRLGLTTSLDCNDDPAGIWDSNIRGVLRHTDIFFPNESEALGITGANSARKAIRQLSEDVRIVAVKLGARGVLISAEGCTFTVPAMASRLVDTTGAGDSFNAGFLAGFLAGSNIRDCTLSGVAAAARTVAVKGGTAAFENHVRLNRTE